MDRSPLTELDTLLNSDLYDILKNVESSKESVAEVLEHNEKQCASWMKSKGMRTEEELREYFASEFEEIEKSLTPTHVVDFSDKDNLEKLLSSIYTLRPQQDRKGFFLKEDRANQILLQVPPVNLLETLGLERLSDLLKILSPTKAIALTRVTESDDWQIKYLEFLKKERSESFEEREIDFLVVDRVRIEKALAISGTTIKPWSMTHNKETGIIASFTHDKEKALKTPFLFTYLLFFHYYFEILRASKALHELSKKSGGTTGVHAYRTIMSTRRKFEFFNPNIHSEALYWEDALRHLSQIDTFKTFEEYSRVLSCGFVLENNSIPSSLNIIDRVWDYNIDLLEPKEAPRFLYHFRESLWGEVLKNLKKATPKEMRSTIFAKIELDDVAFVESLLKSDWT